MPVEAAANIDALNPLWPLGTDTKGQGDDHLRMLKTVLQAAISDDGTTVALKREAVRFSRRSIFTASTTAFQFLADTKWAEVEIQGGGGAGGGTSTGSAAGVASAGSGAGGGGYTKRAFALTAAIRAATKAIVIGAGGVGGPSSGLAGGNSTYSDGTNSMTAQGGTGGSQGAFATQIIIRVGGAAGGSSGGDVNLAGQPGSQGTSYGGTPNGAPTVSAAAGGNGGASVLGSAGVGPSQNTTNAATGTNGGGGSRGAGGAGAQATNAVSSALNGGSGGDGMAIITEYR
jgi:hypothetical protein